MPDVMLALALVLLAGAEPTAPVAPVPPRVEGPAVPAGASPGPTGRVEPPSMLRRPGGEPPGAAAPESPQRAAATPAPPPTRAGPPSPGQRPPKSIAPSPQSDPFAIPPALTAGALRDELRAASQKRQEELAELARERVRLEKLAADIASARAALAAETARLEDRVKGEPGKGAVAKAGPFGRPAQKPAVEGLAKTLKGMKPDQAAGLVSRLDKPLAVSLLRRMRPSDAGAVLEKMKPDSAAELFSLMASSEPDVGGAR